MARYLFAALLAVTAVPLRADPVPQPSFIDPAPDSAEQRDKLRDFTMCLAQVRPNWARATLSHPYLSEAQERAAARALGGTDSCAGSGDQEYTFRTSGIVGSLAEYYLRSSIDRASSARVASALATIEPRNVSEDFALCVAASNPAASRDLVLSDPGSSAEGQAAVQLSPHVRACLMPRERQPVDLQSLRALVATALYRGVERVLTRSN